MPGGEGRPEETKSASVVEVPQLRADEMVSTEIAEEIRISKRESQVAEEEKQKREDEERQELLLKLQQFTTEQLKELK